MSRAPVLQQQKGSPDTFKAGYLYNRIVYPGSLCNMEALRAKQMVPTDSWNSAVRIDLEKPWFLLLVLGKADGVKIVGNAQFFERYACFDPVAMPTRPTGHYYTTMARPGQATANKTQIVAFTL